MKNTKSKESKILKGIGIITAIIILLIFIDWSLGNFIDGWNNPF